MRSQKPYKYHLHDAAAASSQVIYYGNPVTSHAHFNNSQLQNGISSCDS